MIYDLWWPGSWPQVVSVCAGELLLTSLLCPPPFPTFIPTLSISPLKMFPFFSLLSQFSLLSHPFLSSLFILSPSFSRSLPLVSSLLFILSSPPLSSLYYSPFLSSSSLPLFFLFQNQRQRTSESSLTRNTPTPASSIFCDGSGGSESPCAPASPWVRAQIGIAYCCKSPGGSCQICPWPPSKCRPQRNRLLSVLVLPRADNDQDSATLVS